jgi:NAD(P)H-hydrate epimerase
MHRPPHPLQQKLISPLNSAILGVYIHSLAADLTLENQSVESMLITDIIENIGLAFKAIRK